MHVLFSGTAFNIIIYPPDAFGVDTLAASSLGLVLSERLGGITGLISEHVECRLREVDTSDRQ
jgi:hypothetical protein